MTVLCGITQGGHPDQANPAVSHPIAIPSIEMDAVFTDADLRSSTSQSEPNRPNRTLIKLVSQQTPPEIPSQASDAQELATPIYTVQPAGFQQAEGGAFTGPSVTRGTWVLIAPYGWIAGINGSVGVGERVVNVDITPGDVISNLGSINGALMLHTEVGKGDWGFILDANLLRASTSASTARAQVDVTLQQTMIEFLGMHRLMEMPDFLVEGRSATIDVLGGGRYYDFGNIFTVHPFDPNLPTVPANLSSTWVDLVIGGRARVPISKSLDAFARADIGGFGIGDSSTLAWNLIAGADWRMSSCSSLIAGYRELNVNRTGGVGGTAFEYDSKMYGPFMAITFEF